MGRVSVIMGTYRADEERLEKSLRSVIGQTFSDWELIVCSDGDGVERLEKLREWERTDKRIRVVGYERNRGLAYALDEAAKVACGEYIARQDDDDESYPDRLEKEIEFLDEHPKTAFVGTLADMFDDGGIYGSCRLPEEPKKEDFLWTCPFLHPTVLLRRDCFEKVGGYRVAWDTKRAEDYDLFMRLYANGFFGVNLQERLYKYRFPPTGKRRQGFWNRVGEASVRAKGFAKLKMGIKGVPYVLKPVFAELLPKKLYDRSKRKFLQ